MTEAITEWTILAAADAWVFRLGERNDKNYKTSNIKERRKKLNIVAK